MVIRVFACQPDSETLHKHTSAHESGQPATGTASSAASKGVPRKKERISCNKIWSFFTCVSATRVTACRRHSDREGLALLLGLETRAPFGLTQSSSITTHLSHSFHLLLGDLFFVQPRRMLRCALHRANPNQSRAI